MPRPAHAVLVRSKVAHAKLNHIDTDQARAMPGVLGVWTGGDLMCASPLLAIGKVRYVGDPVAMVVAEGFDQARRAAEAVTLCLEPLPAVTDARAATDSDAPTVFAGAPRNVCMDYYYGDYNETVQAFAEAAHITRLRLANSRVGASGWESQDVVASHDEATGGWILDGGSQGVLKVGQLAIPFKVSRERACLCLVAKALRRPVKWAPDFADVNKHDDRVRDCEFDCELALDADGTFLGIRLRGFASLGAYPTGEGLYEAWTMIARDLEAAYRIPLVEISSKVVFTNTWPSGSGDFDTNYFLERLVDRAARETDIDPVELRKRNVPKLWDRLLLERVVIASDAVGFPTRRKKSAATGKLRGLGIANHYAAPEQGSPLPRGPHVAEVEIDQETGWIEVVRYTTASNFGTGDAKGASACGGAVALPSITNAVVDALGGWHIEMPATAERVWRILRTPPMLGLH